MTGGSYKHVMTSLAVLAYWEMVWPESALGTPMMGQKTWESWENFFRREETPVTHQNTQTQNDGCLPICENEGVLYPDRTSCHHFFVCTRNLEVGNESATRHSVIALSTERHSSVREEDSTNSDSIPSNFTGIPLLRCSCLDKRDVYNRYLQRCSRRGHCRVSCTAQGNIFENWTSVTYNGYECSVAFKPQKLLVNSSETLHSTKAYRNEEVAGSTSILNVEAIYPASLASPATISLLDASPSFTQVPDSLPGLIQATGSLLGGNGDIEQLPDSSSLPGSIQSLTSFPATIIISSTFTDTGTDKQQITTTMATSNHDEKQTITDSDTSHFITLKPASILSNGAIHEPATSTTFLKPAVLPATIQTSDPSLTLQIPIILPATIQKPDILPETLPATNLIPAFSPASTQQPTALPALIFPTATQEPAVLPETIMVHTLLPETAQKPDTPEIVSINLTATDIIETPALLPISISSSIQKPVLSPEINSKPNTLAGISVKPQTLPEIIQNSSVTPLPTILPANSLKPAIVPSSIHESGITQISSGTSNVVLKSSLSEKKNLSILATSILPDASHKPVTLPAVIHISTSPIDISQASDMHLTSTQKPALLPDFIGTTDTNYIQITLTNTQTTQKPIILPGTATSSIISRPTPTIATKPATLQSNILSTSSQMGDPVSALVIEPISTILFATQTSILPTVELKPANCRPQICTVAHSRYPNPKDCSRYFKCVIYQGNLVARPYICPSVMPIFSPSLMMCLRGIKCQPTCSDSEVSTSSSVSLMMSSIDNAQGMPSVTSPSLDITTSFPSISITKPFTSDGTSTQNTSDDLAVTESITDTTQTSTTELSTSINSTNNNITNHNITVTAAVYEFNVTDSCDLKCSAPNIKVADPNDCHYYYLCMIAEDLTPRPIRVRCPSGRPVFSTVNGECMSDVLCEVKCYIEPAVESSTPSLLPTATTTDIVIATTADDLFNDAGANNDSLLFYIPNMQNITYTSTTDNSTTSLVATDLVSKISDCSPVCLVPDSWLPDPTDCHYFYVCHFLNDIISRPRRIACPRSRPIFSREEGRCLADGPCEVTCNDPITISPTTLSLSEYPDCKPKCTLPYSMIQDPTDCYHYYICIFVNSLALETLRARCPYSKPIFDPISKGCVKNAECVITCSQSTMIASSTELSINETTSLAGRCDPKCKSPDTLVSDPSNCHYYYICIINDNGTLEAIRMKCPKNYNIFDKTAGSCMPDAKCEEKCLNTSYSDEGEKLTAVTTTSTQDYLTTAIPVISTDLSGSNTLHQLTNNSDGVMGNMTTIIPSTGNRPTLMRPEPCQPNCVSHNSIVHDPMDCHQYFVCMLMNGKSYATNVLCPPEKPIFHLDTYSCQKNVPCIRTCEDLILIPPINNHPTTSKPSLMTTIEHITGDKSTTPGDPTTNNSHVSINNPTTISNYLNITEASMLFFSTIGSNNATESTHTLPLKPTSSENLSTPLISITGEHSTTSMISDTTSVPPILCTPKCTRQGTLIPDYSNCNRYYICLLLDGLTPQPVQGKCPPLTPVFDADKRQCVSEGVCYTPCANQSISGGDVEHSITSLSDNESVLTSCLPFCRKPNTVIPDPKDCRYYYFCSMLKGKLSPNHIRCPDNKPVFDRTSLVCSKDIPCTVSCPNTSLAISEISPTETITHAPSFQACPHAGYFANNEECVPFYDHCYHKGEQIIRLRKRCPKGLVFNPISSYPYCIPPHDCPYDPLKYGQTANATTCRHPGRFPKCKHCCSDYILCVPFPLRNGYIPVASRCTGGLVFNTDPTYPVCIQKTDCPSGEKPGRECDNPGNHPACSECCRDYYHCTHDGRLQRRSCPYPLVFNTIPSYPYCVLAWNCPYILP